MTAERGSDAPRDLRFHADRPGEADRMRADLVLPGLDPEPPATMRPLVRDETQR